MRRKKITLLGVSMWALVIAGELIKEIYLMPKYRKMQNAKVSKR